MKFRALTSKDELLLWRFLALGTGLSKTEVANHPVWSRYGEGWGRDGDFALAASKLRDNERHDVGLIWSRLYSKNHAGFGFIAPDIPEMCLFAESAPDLKKLRGQLLGRLPRFAGASLRLGFNTLRLARFDFASTLPKCGLPYH